MLPFLEELIERKLSDALGAAVSFDRVKLSPLSGKVEVLNLKAALPFSDTPFLTVARIEAKIAMARALKQEISIQSLRIERPFVRLPLPLLSRGRAERKAGEPSNAKPWQFEADDVLIVDATIEFQSAAYHAIAEKVNLSLKRDASEIIVTLLSDRLRRLDPDVPIGPLKLSGRIATRDFSRILASSISLDGALDPHVRVSASTISLESKSIDLCVTGDIDSQLLSRLAPIPLPAIAGLVRLEIDGTFSPRKITLRHAGISADSATIEFR